MIFTTIFDLLGLGVLNQQDQLELLAIFEIKSLKKAIYRKRCLIDGLKKNLIMFLKWNGIYIGNQGGVY